MGWALRHRAWTLGISAVMFIVSFALLPLIPVTFLPESGEKMFMANVSAPPGTGTPEKTVAKVMDAEQIIARLPDVEMYNTSISLGGGGDDMMALGKAMMGMSTRGASIIVVLSPDADLDAVTDMARERLGNLEGALTSIGGGLEDTSSQLEVSVMGRDPEVVRAAALQVVDAVRDMDGVRDVSSASGQST